MISELVIVHRPGGQSQETLAQALGISVNENQVASAPEFQGEFFSWQTCLRQIVLGDRRLLELTGPSHGQIQATDQILIGDDAYRFLLEVICGLHSPLVGETEVYGQFKTKVSQFDVPATPFGSLLRRLFKALFEDAKMIRQGHLEDLGSQSYGSILRRELKGVGRIAILGAGHLVGEILPWIAKNDCAITVYARQPEKARTCLARKDIKIAAWSAELELGAEDLRVEELIVAAPISHAELNALIAGSPQLKRLIDLRADSESFVANRPLKIVRLNEIFALISQNQTKIAVKKAQAHAAVLSAIEVRQTHVEYRPFGWEDVCA